MAISNVQPTGACSCAATSDSASAPHQFAQQLPDPGTLAEAQARHGKMPDGQQLVGVHPAMPGVSYSLTTRGGQVHVIATRAASKTADAPTDLALDRAAAKARALTIQAKNIQFWGLRSHPR